MNGSRSYIIHYTYTINNKKSKGRTIVTASFNPKKDKFFLKDVLEWIATINGYSDISFKRCKRIHSAI